MTTKKAAMKATVQPLAAEVPQDRKAVLAEALRRRIMTFVELPFESLNRMSLQSRVDAIGTDTETKA